jgi:hypothetical protein
MKLKSITFYHLKLIENENKAYFILDMIYLSSENINVAYFNFVHGTNWLLLY